MTLESSDAQRPTGVLLYWTKVISGVCRIAANGNHVIILYGDELTIQNSAYEIIRKIEQQNNVKVIEAMVALTSFGDTIELLHV